MLSVINPVAFSLGPLEVRWYGIIIALAILVGYLIAQREALKKGFKDDTLIDIVMWAVIIGIICARIYYVVFEWTYYKDHLAEIPMIMNGGIAIHGGLIGALLTGYVISRRKKISFFQLADIAAPSIILAQGIGRWGNFMNQEAHGGEVSRSFLEDLHLPQFIIDQMNINGIYYHPTFLYESMWNVLGFILLILIRPHLRMGQTVLLYGIWYSAGRFFIEGLRTDSLMLTEMLRIAQVISIGIIILCVALWIYRAVRYKLPKYGAINHPLEANYEKTYYE